MRSADRVSARDNEPMSLDVASLPAKRGPSMDAPVIAAVCAVVLLALGGWGALALEAVRAGEGPDALWAALCTASGLTGGGFGFRDLAAKLGIWIAMTAAMMLPAASSAAVAHAARLGRGAQAVASAMLMPLVHLAVWSVIAVGLAALQLGVERILSFAVLPDRAAAVIGGAAIGFAGLYQFTPFKDRCLAACRVPLGGFEAGRSGLGASARLGFRYALSCVGCCGPMMAMMVLAGAMNILWMAVFAVLMTVERFAGTALVARIIGAAMVAAGAALSVSAVGLAPFVAVFTR